MVEALGRLRIPALQAGGIGVDPQDDWHVGQGAEWGRADLNMVHGSVGWRPRWNKKQQNGESCPHHWLHPSQFVCSDCCHQPMDLRLQLLQPGNLTSATLQG